MTTSHTDPTLLALLPLKPAWRYVIRLAPLVFLWLVMAGLLGWMLYTWAGWSEQADRADMREWIDNTRIFRKTLSELVREYVDLLQDEHPGSDYSTRLKNKRHEIEEQIRATIEPTRVYSAQLPLFPEVYKLEIDISGVPLPEGREVAPILWESSKPKPGGPSRAQLRTLTFDPIARKNASAEIRMEYQLHTYNQMQHQHDEYRFWQTVAVVVVLLSLLLVAVLVIRVFRRERAREFDQLRTAAAAEHRERDLLQAVVERQLVEKELLESRVKHQEAERATEELTRKILEQQLAAAKLESRAAEAEKSTLELKSQLYASIGIMAGSYAHNIKNLLVRPNDLLSRCIEANGATHEQQGMLLEIKHTLGTVTERLQQILKTVRRDPAHASIARIDLGELVRESERNWGVMGWEKWKIAVSTETPAQPLWLDGDLSHLQQALENLVFNARDATFEMRNHLRDEAKRESDPMLRRHKLLEAAGWKGEVSLCAFRAGDSAVLEVRDNGIGMTEEIRKNCLQTHFTTKRDNALYEGYNAGMGLGLSFVAVVLEHHHATLEIDSSPLRGTTFRIRFPLVTGE